MNFIGPTISALTVVHNRAHLLGETIRSVLDQSYPVHEYIIIDDGSTDHPEQVVASFNDPRIKCFRYDRVGVLTRLRNIAVYRASGDFCAFIDSDDLWHREKLQEHVERVRAGDPVFILSDCQYFNAEGLYGQPLSVGMKKKDDLFWELIERNQSLAFGSSLFFRNLPGVTVFDESLHIGDHDFVTMLCASQPTVYIDRVLNYIRLHPDNMSRSHRARDVIHLLEYNQTALKLLQQEYITVKKFRTIRAANYIKTSLVYFKRRRYAMAFRFASAALSNRLTWPYLRFWLKVAAARMRYGTGR